MVKAIIFDFGNVICTFNNELILEKFSKYAGKSVESLREIIYKNSDLPKQYEMGQISSNEFYEGILKITELNILKENFIEAYTNKFTPILSTFDLIRELKNNYKIALLSNTNEWDFEYGIKKTEVFELFDKVTLSFEVGAMKPNKKIFEDLLNKLKLKPQECIYIDDIKDYVKAAKSLGIHGHQYIGCEDLVEFFEKEGLLVKSDKMKVRL